MTETIEWQRRVAARGYGWYLALKIGKAAIAVPLFVLHSAWAFPLGLACYLYDAFKDCGKELFSLSRDYWRRNWFSGFSRRHYNSLSYYKPAPRPMRSEDIA